MKPTSNFLILTYFLKVLYVLVIQLFKCTHLATVSQPVAMGVHKFQGTTIIRNHRQMISLVWAPVGNPQLPRHYRDYFLTAYPKVGGGAAGRREPVDPFFRGVDLWCFC